ncbi:MAG: hypothetical protein IPM92_09675 [Saprospiraceae bacterium]|nr:hypothetical protein [Saprospiraceae bacterium]
MNNLSIAYTGPNKLYDGVTFAPGASNFREWIDRRFNHHRLRNNAEQVQAYSANLDFEKHQ